MVLMLHPGIKLVFKHIRLQNGIINASFWHKVCV